MQDPPHSLGNSLDNFMREIWAKLKDREEARRYKRLQDQMRSLIDARISFESDTETHSRYLHVDMSSSAES